MADRDISLMESGPDAKNLVASSGDWIKFINNTKHDVELVLDNPGLFSPSPDKLIEIADGESWSGHIGDTKEKCRYSYEAPGHQSALRTGTIEVS